MLNYGCINVIKNLEKRTVNKSHPHGVTTKPKLSIAVYSQSFSRVLVRVPLLRSGQWPPLAFCLCVFGGQWDKVEHDRKAVADCVVVERRPWLTYDVRQGFCRCGPAGHWLYVMRSSAPVGILLYRFCCILIRSYRLMSWGIALLRATDGHRIS